MSAFAGDSRDTPIHKDFKLEQWKWLFPHDNWQSGPRQQTALPDFTGEWTWWN